MTDTTAQYFCRDCNGARSMAGKFKGRTLADCRRMVYESAMAGAINFKVFCLLCDELDRMSREESHGSQV